MRMYDKFCPRKGMLIILSGPSGAGKNTLVSRFLKSHLEVKYSISTTTREPRGNETNGVDYHFVTETQFKDMVNSNELLEWAHVYGHYYGTPKAFIAECIDSGIDVILDLDIKGAAQVKERFPEGVFVFLVPPSASELRQRVKARGTDTDQALDLRISCVHDEIKAIVNYQYLVINNDLEDAYRQLDAIITAERCKVSRLDSDEIVRTFATVV